MYAKLLFVIGQHLKFVDLVFNSQKTGSVDR